MRKRDILAPLARRLVIKHDETYPQTWTLFSQLRSVRVIGPPLYRMANWLCGKWGGHEWSQTEWGYGGGTHCDRWCRWCNYYSVQPLAEQELDDQQRFLMGLLSENRPPFSDTDDGEMSNAR